MTSFSSKRFSSLFVTTAAIGASIGIGTGLALRLAATTTGPGASFFHSEQSFPTLNGWPGEVIPIQPPPIAPSSRDSNSTIISPEPIQIERPQVAPVNPPMPEAVEPVPEVAPASPTPVPPPAVVEPSPLAPPPTVIAPEPAAPSLPTVPEPLPPPATNQPAAPPPAAN